MSDGVHDLGKLNAMLEKKPEPESFADLRDRIRAAAVANVRQLVSDEVLAGVDEWFKTEIEPHRRESETSQGDRSDWAVQMTPQWLKDRLGRLEKIIIANVLAKVGKSV